MTSPLEIIQSFERHVKSEVQMGLASLEGSVAAIMPVLTARIRKLPKVSMDEVTSLNEYLGDDRGTFTRAQRQEISKLVKPLLDSEVARSTSKQSTKTQSHLYQQHYYPAKLWNKLDSDDEMDDKMRAIGSFFCQNLGLRNPDEQTMRQAVVIANIKSGKNPDPTEAYKQVRNFAKIMDQKRTAISSVQTLARFPKDPSDFIKIYPGAYGEPPVECRIDESLIAERSRSDVTPCRNTSTSVQKVDKASSHRAAQSSSSGSDNSMQGLLFGLVERMMFNDNRSQSQNRSDLRNALEDARGSRGSTGGNQNKTPLLSIEDDPNRDRDPDSLVSGGVGDPKIQAPSVHDKLKALQSEVQGTSKEALLAAESRAKADSDDSSDDSESENDEEGAPKKKKKKKSKGKKKNKKTNQEEKEENREGKD